MLHPLLQENTSDLSEQQFTSTFTGDEFFLADHVVKGERVLPGVAYLEMARAAVERASGSNGGALRLENVVWARPVIVNGEPAEVRIGLYPEQAGAIEYEIYTGSDEVHSQGRALVMAASEGPVFDVGALLASCQQRTMSAQQCYALFEQAGLAYGPAHRGLKAVHVGTGSSYGGIGAAGIAASDGRAVRNASERYGCGAASHGGIAGRMRSRLLLPFAVERVNVYRPTPVARLGLGALHTAGNGVASL